MALKRVNKELQKFRKEPIAGIEANPVGDNLLHWKASVKGPPGEIYPS
jgi:ubiquitin-conjugating enzyme E2 D/E